MSLVYTNDDNNELIIHDDKGNYICTLPNIDRPYFLFHNPDNQNYIAVTDASMIDDGMEFVKVVT